MMSNQKGNPGDSNRYDRIVRELKEKAAIKQAIFRRMVNTYGQLRREIQNVVSSLEKDIGSYDQSVEIAYKEKGEFETHLKFGGDTLIFLMHTNVFAFPEGHFVNKTEYVKEDKMRAYCGMIMIYNFLSDSLRYNRIQDTGILIARLFVNKEGRFFAHGRKQFSYLYKDFGDSTLSGDHLKNIVHTAVLHALEFDLEVPPVEMTQEITLMQKLQESGHLAIKTGKKLGFETGESTDSRNQNRPSWDTEDLT